MIYGVIMFEADEEILVVEPVGEEPQASGSADLHQEDDLASVRQRPVIGVQGARS